MLKLCNIVKNYVSGNDCVRALKGVSLEFRENEFVAVLGQSGCGKTTLLNIIGGLDQFTGGDLIINGKSTRQYKDADWDTYRNHSIGFVFQSYNLIPHQTVLANVELALTLSGVSKEERRRRAVEVLQKVGLGDQLRKKPNQMSGGQMQRVAIARALVNDPDIILADEPTGALDSKTSLQIMDLLREISKDKLIIMVTHNPDLAKEYATRTITLLDGLVVDDTRPFDSATEVSEKKVDDSTATIKKVKEKKKKSMSFLTALSLSFNNLLTKKGRTFLTSFAGSIGIIGIALILSVSSGVNAYIRSIEESTVSSYPLTITESSLDTTSMLSAIMEMNAQSAPQDENKVYSNDVMVSMINSAVNGITSNNLEKFKSFLDGNEELQKYVNDIKYSYSANLNTYSEIGGVATTETRNMSGISELMGLFSFSGTEKQTTETEVTRYTSDAWRELIGNDDFIKSQYSLVTGRFPTSENEIVLIVDENNRIADYILFVIGLRDKAEITSYLAQVSQDKMQGKETTATLSGSEYTFDELLSLKFKVLLDSDYYKLDGNTIRPSTDDELNDKLTSARELSIVGIIKSADESTSGMQTGGIGYLPSLMKSLVNEVNGSTVVTAQKENPTTDLFTGKAFETSLMATSTLSSNLAKLGYVDINRPSAVSIYPKDFDSKDQIVQIIKQYNADQVSDKDKITYTDTVALLMSSVTTIVNAISYVLVAFVAISLVVSSIMIGIITYISVLERTKEIGILRAVGASKKDISRVFNAETLIVGFGAGAIGILVSLGLIVIINIILHALTDIASLNAVLPIGASFILIAISMFLTFIAGLIPSGLAAKKDPVIALRTE